MQYTALTQQKLIINFVTGYKFQCMNMTEVTGVKVSFTVYAFCYKQGMASKIMMVNQFKFMVCS